MSIIKINDSFHLRLLTEEDAAALFDLTERNRKRLSEWMTWLDIVRSVGEARWYISRSRQQSMTDDAFLYGIWDVESLAGFIDIHSVNHTTLTAELGYWIGVEYEGKGLVTMASEALTNHAFDKLGLERMEIYCATDNLRSRGIPERLGFIEERVIPQAAWHRDHFIDYAVYVMDSAQWRRRNTSSEGDSHE